MTHRTQDNYAQLLANSERLAWTVDQVLGERPQLDLERPFLPEAMTRSRELAFLSPDERRALSQLHGYTYAGVSSVLEEGILPFVLERLRGRSSAATDEVRALLRFADEEAKHIQLFSRYMAAYRAQLGIAPQIAFEREASIAATKSAHPLTSALMSAHIEWMTQTHYVQATKAGTQIDPVTLRMLSYHYVEEVQHARIDEVLIDSIGRSCSAGEIEEAIAAYRGTCGAIAAVLGHQAERDIDSLQAATGRSLSADERAQFMAHQHAVYVDNVLGVGQQHGRVERAIEGLRQLPN